MPEVRIFGPTWLDKQYRKDFEKLRPAEQVRCREHLAELLEALQRCAHPVQDAGLKRWRPTPYRGIPKIKGEGHLVEYRLPGLFRVIACYFEKPGMSIPDVILLVAATLKHDHERLKRLIQGHRHELEGWE